MSIVVRDPNDLSKVRILVKGSTNMRDCLDLSDKQKEIFEVILRKFEKQGLIPVIYAQR